MIHMFLSVLSLITAQMWVVQPSGTTASLRGVSAVNDRVVWASGTGGTVLRTNDGGATWRISTVVEGLDFRGVRAFSDTTAALLSSGPGSKSQIYKVAKRVFTNPDATGFFDAIAFWDPAHGIVLGDPVDGSFVILTTSDGGQTWTRRQGPEALPKEGAFAASNTCLIVAGKQTAWFGTGGARVFRSDDGGVTWAASKTPIRNNSPSAGVFSLSFSDMQHGVAVGGDYAKPDDNTANIAITSDGGATWEAPAGTRPNGYRSAVVYLADRRAWIATGTTGSDVSMDNGRNWKQFDTTAFNALSAVASQAVWAVGPNGRIARLRWP
jgi:photosystem II stability/assembly factor-like uncharacterized protein